jgi:hypothetical protein
MGSERDTTGKTDAAPQPGAGLPFPFCAPPSLDDLGPVGPAELRALVHDGENDSDACERVPAQVARIAGALDLALGDGLAALERLDGFVKLGFSDKKDYAREVLDLGQRHAQKLAHLSRELDSRPRLRAAVRAGKVRIRNAETVLPVAKGDAEAAWTMAAERLTVRALAAMVKRARDGMPDGEDEAWVRFRFRLDEAQRKIVDEGLEIAGRLLPGSRRHERLEAMAMEFLGGHALVDSLIEERRRERGEDGRLGGAFTSPPRRDRARQEARLERETLGWSYLESPAAIPVPDLGLDDAGLSTPAEIDARLHEVAALRSRWDALVGVLSYLVQRSGLWKVAGFDSFAQYARERLGLSARTVEQRARLEAVLAQKPALRAARNGGVSYERLRVLSRLPNGEIGGWAEKAKTVTVVSLRQAVDARDDAQMRARQVMGGWVPAGVATLLDGAIRVAQTLMGGLYGAGTCLVQVAQYFIEASKDLVNRGKTRSQKIRERDLGRCQCPGCSRRATHSHHITPRSRGGSDDPSNLVALCTLHHLFGVHGGYLAVEGEAPDNLRWTLLRGPRGPEPFTGGVATPREVPA